MASYSPCRARSAPSSPSCDRSTAWPSSRRARLSPYAAVDVGVWQDANWGLVLHAGQSFPLNLTGMTSAVTDLSAAVRVDVSERVSFYAGYRLFLVQLKEYPQALTAASPRDEFDSALGGPLLGLEVRF